MVSAQFVDIGVANMKQLDTESDPFWKAIFNEQQRFGLWARNLGLYHRGHNSLDYRL